MVFRCGVYDTVGGSDAETSSVTARLLADQIDKNGDPQLDHAEAQENLATIQAQEIIAKMHPIYHLRSSRCFITLPGSVRRRTAPAKCRKI